MLDVVLGIVRKMPGNVNCLIFETCLMHCKYVFLIPVIMGFFSCKKETSKPGNPPPHETPIKHILLKDITIPRLPSPYYHFEYDSDSIMTKAEFASSLSSYNVFYKNDRISEMRNHIVANQDTLRYVYDNAGKVAVISFINNQNVVYRHVSFNYNGEQIKEIYWDHKVDNVGFLIDRSLKFDFYPDGNVKSITEHRPEVNGSPEYNSVRTFDLYDKNISVDDFGLIHDGFHDHLFIPQGFHLQKNNPKKESLKVNGADYYTIDYTYTYKSDNTPITKTGDLLFISGDDAGKRFQTNTAYSYY